LGLVGMVSRPDGHGWYGLVRWFEQAEREKWLRNLEYICRQGQLAPFGLFARKHREGRLWILLSYTVIYLKTNRPAKLNMTLTPRPPGGGLGVGGF
jgi:hypothetical protein